MALGSRLPPPGVDGGGRWVLVVFALVARACRFLSVGGLMGSSCWCVGGGGASRMVGVGAERRHRARWGPGRTRGVGTTRPLERLLGFWVPRRCRIHPPRRLLLLFAWSLPVWRWAPDCPRLEWTGVGKWVLVVLCWCAGRVVVGVLVVLVCVLVVLWSVCW